MENEIYAQRSSVRSFTRDDVPQELVEKLLHAAVEAPSAGNLQPWHFYVVRDAEVKKKLHDNAYHQKFIQEAPLVIVVCAEPSRSATRYEERGINLYCIQDTAAAIENILLCAAQNGLGSCWCGAFDENAVAEVICLPENRRPVAVIPIGYPENKRAKPKRRPIEDVVTFI